MFLVYNYQRDQNDSFNPASDVVGKALLNL
jgi:hypothetical protein